MSGSNPEGDTCCSYMWPSACNPARYQNPKDYKCEHSQPWKLEHLYWLLGYFVLSSKELNGDSAD